MLRFTILAALVSCALGATVLTAANKALFLKLHNDARAEIPYNLPPLQWDDSLAAKAENNVNNCQFGHSSRADLAGQGENIAASWPDPTTDDSIRSAVNGWNAEKSRVPTGVPDDDKRWACAFTSDHDTTCGHYSQVIWKDTTRVGCAVKVCPDRWGYVTCRYYPAGNVGLLAPDGSILPQRPY